MRIAIVGSGISGLVAAYRLHSFHDVQVFEAADYVGGHTNTVDVQIDGMPYSVDTGFIVFNDRTYPNFCRLLSELKVDSCPTAMSFSVRSDPCRLEYNGSSLAGLFAQKRNLLRPSFYRMIRDILRFNQTAPQVLNAGGDDMTVGEYLQAENYSVEFAQHYLLPMGAAIWSCPVTTFESFPVRFIVEFYQNHGLLSLKDRPTWHVVKGGSAQYVRALTAGFRDCISLNTPVVSVRRTSDSVEVITDTGSHTFDEVIFACHSDQVLRILGHSATETERAVLNAIPYQPNTATLHTDDTVLPRRRRAWACWNYHISDHRASSPGSATLTYNMNLLQHLRCDKTICVTLNDDGRIQSDHILARFQYSHPVFTVQRRTAQQRHSELIRNHRTSYCGAYWGNGFHEDGVNSALAVVRAFAPEDHRVQPSTENDMAKVQLR